MEKSSQEAETYRFRMQKAIDEFASLDIRMVLLHGIAEVQGVDVCSCNAGEGCASPGKHPLRKGWKASATSNPSIVKARFDAATSSNLGVATGQIVVIDFDPRHGSDQSEEQFVESNGSFPPTVEAATGGGGRHLYYDATGWRVGNSLPALADLEGIDIRGHGGLAVAPPSRHISGGTYEWITPPFGAITKLPPTLTRGLVADLLVEDRPESVTPYAWGALADEYHKVGESQHGSRNDRLYAAACALGELVAGGGIDAYTVTEYLNEAASIAGLGADEAVSTIRSGLNQGKLNPRSVKPAFQNRRGALAELTHLRQVAHGLKWSGHAGKRQIAVLEALIRCAMRSGGPVFTKGVRGIALEAGLASSDTVLRALNELQKKGWVRRVHKGTSVQDPSRWKLQIPQTELRYLNEVTPPLDGGIVQASQHPQLPVGHDAFRRQKRGRYIPEWGRYLYYKGIDKTSWRVLERLIGGPQPTRKSIAELLGVHPSTAGRSVKSLMNLGLVEQRQEGLVATIGSLEDLDQVAEKLGTAGAAADQRDRLGWTKQPTRLAELESCPHRPPCSSGYIACE